MTWEEMLRMTSAVETASEKAGRKKVRHVEDRLQVACVRWFGMQYPELAGLLHHSPNGGARSKTEGAMFKAMGTRAGFPDLFLYVARFCDQSQDRVRGMGGDTARNWGDCPRSDGAGVMGGDAGRNLGDCPRSDGGVGGWWHGLAIEMKTMEKGSRQSEAQKVWERLLRGQGYRYEVCRSLEEFIEVVNDYIKGV